VTGVWFDSGQSAARRSSGCCLSVRNVCGSKRRRRTRSLRLRGRSVRESSSLRRSSSSLARSAESRSSSRRAPAKHSPRAWLSCHEASLRQPLVQQLAAMSYLWQIQPRRCTRSCGRQPLSSSPRQYDLPPRRRVASLWRWCVHSILFTVFGVVFGRADCCLQTLSDPRLRLDPVCYYVS
jgi:hypothetical protein